MTDMNEKDILIEIISREGWFCKDTKNCDKCHRKMHNYCNHSGNEGGLPSLYFTKKYQLAVDILYEINPNLLMELLL